MCILRAILRRSVISLLPFCLFTACNPDNSKTSTSHPNLNEPATTNRPASPPTQLTKRDASRTKPRIPSNSSIYKSRSVRSSENPATTGTALYGKILQSNKQPAIGAEVTLLGYYHESSRDYGELGTTITASDGSYKISTTSPQILHLTVKGDYPHVWKNFYSDELKDAQKKDIECNITLPKPHAVSGLVLNKNLQPVGNVSVSIKTGIDEATGLTALARETTTTAAGEFAFTNILAGLGFCGAKAEKYSPAVEAVNVPTSAPIVIYLGNRGGSVTGKVLLKTTNNPVPDMEIRLYPVDGGESALWESPKATTNATGAFSFENVSTATQKLTVRPTPPMGLGIADPVPANITLSDSDTTDVVVFVYPGYTLSGRIYDKNTSAPIPNVMVSAQAGGRITATSDASGHYYIPGIFATSGTQILISAESDGYAMDSENGGFISVMVPATSSSDTVLKDIPMIPAVIISGSVVTGDDVPITAGSVNLVVPTSLRSSEPSPINDDSSFEIIASPNTDAYIKAQAKGYAPAETKLLQIGDKDITDIKIVMGTGCVIQGQVLLPDDTPAANAEIVQRVTKMNFMGGSTSYEPIAKSDANGKFQLLEMPRQVEFKARLAPYADSQYAVLSMNPAELRSNIILKLTDSREISGRVVDVKGKPVPSIYVGIVNGTGEDSTQTDESGKFIIKGLDDGKYNVRAASSKDHATVNDVAAGTSDLEIVLGKPALFTLQGTVLDEATDKPVSDFVIDEFNVTPQSDGKFVINGLTIKESRQLQISSPKHTKQSFTITPPTTSSVITKVFKLGTDGVISGRLLESGTQTPIAGVSIKCWKDYTAYSYGGQPRAVTTSDADGRFVIGPIPSGQNQIEFKPEPPYTGTFKTMVVKSDQNNDMGDIELSKDGIVRGQVVKGSAKIPVPGATVYCGTSKNGTPTLLSVTADVQGRFEFKDLPGHTVSLRVETTFLGVKVDSARPADVVIHIGSTTLKGQITHAGKGVQTSIIARAGDQYFRGNSTAGGLYQIENIAPGTYNFSINGPTTLEEIVTIPDQPEFTKDFILPD